MRLMHQLRVQRCEICQAPFLFESSLEDHKNQEHANKKEGLSVSVTDKRMELKPKTKRKRKSNPVAK
jgi:hypothetical protein